MFAKFYLRTSDRYCFFTRVVQYVQSIWTIPDLEYVEETGGEVNVTDLIPETSGEPIVQVKKWEAQACELFQARSRIPTFSIQKYLNFVQIIGDLFWLMEKNIMKYAAFI